MTIQIGAAGSDGLGYMKAITKAARMGLGCVEVAFTYGVRMKPEEAEAVERLAREKGITLSVHAPYYINLAADDSAKLAASKERILSSCRMAAVMGARNVVFHAGFYQQRSAANTFARIAKAIDRLQAAVQRQRWDVVLCPYGGFFASAGSGGGQARLRRGFGQAPAAVSRTLFRHRLRPERRAQAPPDHPEVLPAAGRGPGRPEGRGDADQRVPPALPGCRHDESCHPPTSGHRPGLQAGEMRPLLAFDGFVKSHALRWLCKKSKIKARESRDARRTCRTPQRQRDEAQR